MAAEVQPAGNGIEIAEKLAAVNLDDKTEKEVESGTATSTEPSSIAASLRENKSMTLKIPIPDPLVSAIPPPTPLLSADQKSKYDSLLDIVKRWEEVPAGHGKGGPITDSETMWLTRECLLRYLRATKWRDVEDAAKRLLATLTWRREYGVEDLTGDYVSPESETGKQIILGFDFAARPCHYLNPGRQNTEPSPRQVQHLVFMLERVINLMVPGQETLALLINFKTSKSRSNTAPGIGQGREVLNILQTHYPERLGKALIINVPWIVNGFFKLITPFIDPLTREKLKFNDDMRQYVPPEQLWTEFQGDLEFEYDHETYWPMLLKLCEERRSEQWQRWVKAGKQIGESEAYLRGGNTPSVAPLPVAEAREMLDSWEKSKNAAPVEAAPVEASSIEAAQELSSDAKELS